MTEIETNRSDSSATTPGAILKRCREYHNLSLEEAEESTKIGASYLAALEDDQISQFASLAYLKGFLRIYATYLGLNPDDMIRLYEKLYSSGGKKTDQRNSTSADASDSSPRKKFPFRKLALPAFILVLMLITATIINRSSSPPERKNQPVPAPIPTIAASIQKAPTSVKRADPAKPLDKTLVEQKQGESQPPGQIHTQKSSSEDTKSFVIRLKATQSGTLTVTIDDSNSQAYDLAIGDSIEWKADRTISLELSNAGGVEAELNGRQLKPFGPFGKPATVVLDSEGIKQ